MNYETRIFEQMEWDPCLGPYVPKSETVHPRPKDELNFDEFYDLYLNAPRPDDPAPAQTIEYEHMKQCDVEIRGAWKLGTIVKLGGNRELSKSLFEEFTLASCSLFPSVVQMLIKE